MRRVLSAALGLALVSCDGGINVFAVQDDLTLGAQLAAEIEADPVNYPVIDRSDNPEAYAAFDRIIARVLDSGAVELRDELVWQFRLIDDDTVVNAFAAPGGYVWVYSGLIEALANEDSFAGVIAHEIGHADGRHSTEALTRVYGLSLLFDILFDNGGGLAGDVAEGLAGLEFSRANERDADERSVRYLCDSPYAADSVALFFEELEGTGGPTFLSTHPAPENRVSDVRQLATDLECSTELSGLTDFETLRAALRTAN